jgi:protein required for attachment to host cells
MYRVCIAIVDASRARLFQYERALEPEGPHEHLLELTALVNPSRRLRPSELLSSSGQGNHVGAHGYALDDHREDHMAHLDDDFARAVTGELKLLVAGVDRLIICASPRMLGRLRDVIGAVHRPGLAIDEIPHDLVKLTPPQLQDQLVSYGVLPPPLSRSSVG